MNDPKEIAKVGLNPSDYQTSTLEQIVAAAKEFERLLNSAPTQLRVEVDHIDYETAQTAITHFRVRVRQHGIVYP